MMNHEEEESNLHESREEMETLPLDDKSNGHSSSSPSSIIDHHSIILDPPSYADAMFTSFDPQSNGHNKPATSSRPTKSGDYYLIISVSDPQLEQETSPTTLVPGGTTYYTYLITTQTNVTEFTEPGHHDESESESESEFTVRRRFKDVVTLSDRLTESHRGLLIPLRPDKNIVESQVMQKQEFVEQRRVSLERYLKRLAAHPVIRRSEELRVFLTVRGRMPLARSVDVASRMLDGAARLPRQLLGEEASVVDVREMERPASGGRDLVRIWKEMKQYVVNDWGGAKPLVVEEDKGFLERKERMVEFEHHLSNLSKQVFAFCFCVSVHCVFR